MPELQQDTAFVMTNELIVEDSTPLTSNGTGESVNTTIKQNNLKLETASNKDKETVSKGEMKIKKLNLKRPIDPKDPKDTINTIVPLPGPSANAKADHFDHVNPPPSKYRPSTSTSVMAYGRSRGLSVDHQSKYSVGKSSAISNSTANSSGMDRAGYNESNTIAIPEAYKPEHFGLASGIDKYTNPPGHVKHRFTRTGSFNISTQRRRSKMKADDRYVIPGQKVVEGHQNYIMAYNMITGIRVAVSRCSWLPSPVKNDDFKSVSKLIFDMEGNQLTPSTKYEFKFKDYAPEVFRRLRTIYGIDQADYLLSLTERVSLNELGSPGKSGSFFYYSRDYRFIIKTIHHSEHRQLRRILKRYYEYVEKNPDSFLCQFYGLHRLKMHSKRGIQKVHFIVMNNIFPPHREMHLTYDLKGSTYGRETDVEKARTEGKTTIIAKDLNLLKTKDKISLGPAKKKPIFKQLQKDIKLLKELNIMDYSLLVGIHDLRKRAQEDPDNVLSHFDPPELPTISSGDISPVFVESDGGIHGTNSEDQDVPLVYYMGVIDCLTNYSTFKRLETLFRSINHKKEVISAIPADEYGDRFLSFMDKGMGPKTEAELAATKY